MLLVCLVVNTVPANWLEEAVRGLVRFNVNVESWIEDIFGCDHGLLGALASFSIELLLSNLLLFLLKAHLLRHFAVDCISQLVVDSDFYRVEHALLGQHGLLAGALPVVLFE